MINVIIPMAGAGSRFEKAGYSFPKPLIEVKGKPMIQAVVENLNIDGKYIFIVQKEHYEKYALASLLNLITHKCEIVIVDKLTEGAVCTVLLAKKFIDNDDELVIANSDQILDWNPQHFIHTARMNTMDGLIVTFNATHPKWSFAKVDKGLVVEVAEKNPISNIATAGVYYYKKGKDFVKYAERMINKKITTNGEFYVCPVYNEYIEEKKKIKVYPIKQMHGIGTPEDLNRYLDR